MNYRVLRPFGAHQPGDITDGHNCNVDYLIANGMIEPADVDTTTPAAAARTITKKRKGTP